MINYGVTTIIASSHKENSWKIYGKPQGWGRDNKTTNSSNQGLPVVGDQKKTQNVAHAGPLEPATFTRE